MMFSLTTPPNQSYRQIELVLAIACYRLGALRYSDSILGTVYTVQDVANACDRATGFTALIENVEYMSSNGKSGLAGVTQKTKDMYEYLLPIPNHVLGTLINELLS